MPAPVVGKVVMKEQLPLDYYKLEADSFRCNCNYNYLKFAEEENNYFLRIASLNGTRTPHQNFAKSKPQRSERHSKQSNFVSNERQVKPIDCSRLGMFAFAEMCCYILVLLQQRKVEPNAEKRSERKTLVVIGSVVLADSSSVWLKQLDSQSSESLYWRRVTSQNQGEVCCCYCSICFAFCLLDDLQ